MSIKNSEFEKFGNILADDVLSKLVGSHNNFKRGMWHDYPSKNILIGVLHGTKEFDSNLLEDKRLINSISLKFLVEDFISDINVDYKFFLYYRVFPSFNEQLKSKRRKSADNVELMRVWKRKEVKGTISFDKLTKKISISNDLSKVVDEIKNDPNVLKKVLKIPTNSLESEESFNEFINKQKNIDFTENYNWDCHFDIKMESFVQNSQRYTLIELTLVNDTFSDKKIKLFDSSIFNPILKISLNENIIAPFSYANKDSYYESYLRCINCQGDYDSFSNVILTQNFADFNQKKLMPRDSLSDIDISFENLSKRKGIRDLEKIYNKMNDFYNESPLNKNEYIEFFEMKERFNSNIDLLKSNKNVLKAFNLMNETFKRNSKYSSWRLFQIVFIISQLKDIVLDEQKNTCELLHVMTGGGKSETYFGIVIFTAFYDRLSGKKFGVSALTKFPLRMLSIQQLQRIANIFIHAEQIRKENNIAGNHFSIAYFVGSQDSDFPADNRDILLDILDAKEKNEKITGKIIEYCPLCGNKVFLDIDSEKQVVVHKCDGCDEEFHLYYTDDEIYRMLPTFIVSTVDKWSGISNNRRFRNLLGGKLSKCNLGHGFIPAGDTCGFKVGKYKNCEDLGHEINISFDTSPSLIIQDEMHLIKEGFGTIDSHFESLIEVMKSEFTYGSKFKNIVMTATVSGATNQIKNLYHKNTRIFPPNLENDDGELFFFNQQIEDEKDIIQRKIIGLKPTLLNYRILFYILRYIGQFIKDLEEDFESFSERYGFSLKELKEIHEYYKKFLTYHNKKEAAHNVAYSIDDYVNNHDDNYHVQVEPLTGDNNLDEIKAVMRKIDHFYDNKNNKDKLFAINATSIVSHGVDIDEWNIMIFDGMPRSTSEYIQALSRVGRKKFGLVFVVFSSTKSRDLSFYQNFDEYHGLLESKVENVPLSRWAKLGFKQTFTSIFSAALLNYLPNLIGQPTFNPNVVKKILSNSENREILINFIRKAYISNSNMIGADYFDKMIEEEFDERANWLISHKTDAKLFTHALIEYNDKYFKTQYGMRGIQDEISLAPINSDVKFRASLRRNN